MVSGNDFMSLLFHRDDDFLFLLLVENHKRSLVALCHICSMLGCFISSKRLPGRKICMFKIYRLQGQGGCP